MRAHSDDALSFCRKVHHREGGLIETRAKKYDYVYMQSYWIKAVRWISAILNPFVGRVLTRLKSQTGG